jgi:hypothetical protein
LTKRVLSPQQLPSGVTEMINTTRKGSRVPHALLMVLAAAAGTAVGEIIRGHLATLG